MPERGHHVGLKVIPLEEVLLLVGHRGDVVVLDPLGDASNTMWYDAVDFSKRGAAA